MSLKIHLFKFWRLFHFSQACRIWTHEGTNKGTKFIGSSKIIFRVRDINGLKGLVILSQNICSNKGGFIQMLYFWLYWNLTIFNLGKMLTIWETFVFLVIFDTCDVMCNLFLCCHRLTLYFIFKARIQFFN